MAENTENKSTLRAKDQNSSLQGRKSRVSILSWFPAARKG